MFFKNIKDKIKQNFPIIANKLISFRDTNKFFRLILSFKKIDLNKNIHGKRIVNIKNNYFNNRVFLSYNFRPLFEKDTFPKINFNNSVKDCAIIIQGSIKNYEKFVIETIKIYNKIFPKILIVLSTWEDEVNESFFNKVKNFNDFKLILNKKNSTKYNVNLQITSTSSALDYIVKKNFQFSLKTRTDCRIYNPNALYYLKSLTDTFKVRNSDNLKYRILTSSIDTRIFRVYGLSDICLFGESIDLQKYFFNESYEDSLKKMDINLKNPIVNDTAVINEIFLCARFLHKTNNKLHWSLEDWWEKCRDLFCVFDARSLDIFWYKYHWKYEQRFTTNYTSSYNQSLQFSDWINMLNHNTNIYHQSNKEKWHLKNGLLEQKN